WSAAHPRGVTERAPNDGLWLCFAPMRLGSERRRAWLWGVLAWAALHAGGCDRPKPRSTTPPVTRPAQKPPASRSIPDPFVRLAAHARHTCAVRQSGAVLCWGRNTYGQLGDGRRQDNARLVRVAGVHDATD